MPLSNFCFHWGTKTAKAWLIWAYDADIMETENKMIYKCYSWLINAEMSARHLFVDYSLILDTKVFHYDAKSINSCTNHSTAQLWFLQTVLFVLLLLC